MASAVSEISVLLIDDHAVVRQGICACLIATDHVRIVGQCGSGSEGLAAASRLRPDVIVLDEEMPGLSGLETLRILRAQNRESKVLFYAANDTIELYREVAKAGARGILLKSGEPSNFPEAIVKVYLGEFYLDPEPTRSLVNDFMRGEPSLPARVSDPRMAMTNSSSGGARLTRRELEVLALVARGFTSRNIGAKLRISVRTVEAHRANIADKLGIRSVAELTKYAVTHELVEAH